jgi:hypothetical protein
MSQMSAETEKAAATPAPDSHAGGDATHAEHRKGHGHSHWMMIACCVPMVLVAVFLLAGGAGLAAFAPALLCAAMMGLMMLGMSRLHRGNG